MTDIAYDFLTDVETDNLEALAAAARDGDSDAFDRLIRSVAGRLMAFAYRVLGDRPLAEEAVQDALVRIYRFLPRYKSKNFLAWAFMITHRACLDVIKRERRNPVPSEPARDREPATDDHTDRIDVRASIDAALAAIPEQLRTTFLLVQQGLSYEDVAGILVIPIGTVRSRVHEARRLLRILLSPMINGGTQ